MPTPLKTLRPGHIPPSPHPTPATGNDYSFPGQPKLPTTGQVVSEDPYTPILKHSTAQMAPMAALATHAQRSFFLPLPPPPCSIHPLPPTALQAVVSPLPVSSKELAQRMCPK